MSNLVNAERVTLSYGTRTLLDDISLGLGGGEAVGVVGRNGAGKTTLLQVLAGTLVPDAGRVTHTGHLSIGDKREIDKAIWCKPYGIKMTPTSRYIRDKLLPELGGKR